MTKKIVLFIVEGVTDKHSLGLILSRIYKNDNIRFHIVGTDITSQYGASPKNIVGKINNEIVKFRNGVFEDSDIEKVIHLVDTDGAFIPDDKVIYGEVNKTSYEDDCIRTKHVDALIGRNKTKSTVLDYLTTVECVRRNIPYRVYYFSCNLEHVLHGVRNLPDDKKRRYSENFQDRFYGKEKSFIEYMGTEEFTAPGDYTQTWEHIKKDCNSLLRNSNFHKIFE